MVRESKESARPTIDNKGKYFNTYSKNTNDISKKSCIFETQTSERSIENLDIFGNIASSNLPLTTEQTVPTYSTTVSHK